MGTITLTPPVAGTAAVAGTFTTAFSTIQTVVNGNIDNTNINAAAAIAYSKLALANSLLTTDVSTGAGNAWTPYTPTWASSGTQPVVNNGAIAGRYIRIGKLVIFQMSLTMGTTTTFGTGNYSFSLPVAALASSGLIGQTFGNDDSGVVSNHAYTYLGSATVCNCQYPATWPTGTLTAYGVSAPWTWANLDLIRVIGSYETS